MKFNILKIIDWIFHTAILIILILILLKITNRVKVINTVDVWGTVDVEVQNTPLEVEVQEPLEVEVWR